MNTLALGDSFNDDLGIFDDLKSNTMVGEEAAAIKDVLNEAKENTYTDDIKVENETELKKSDDNKSSIEDGLDSSFYTSSFIITDEDLEDLKSIDKNIKKNNKLIKILIMIFSSLIAVILLTVIAKLIF